MAASGRPVMRWRSLVVALLVAGLAAAPAAAGEIELTPVKRVPFPKRSWVVDIGRDASIESQRVHLSENGIAIRKFTVRPLAANPLNSALVLAIDASDSMAGPPYGAAVEAARSFAATRSAAERIGIVAFNGDVTVVQEPTRSAEAIGAALDDPPTLAYGTHIYDAVQDSLGLIEKANAATGTIIVLSDGADVGSLETLEGAIASARSQGVRVFTVGLRSATYDPAPLRKLASETGGAYYEAESAVELGPIYNALGARLASQFLLEYRSEAIPRSGVILRFAVDGLGVGAFEYTAPRPAASAPFHRSLWRRFVLSSFATPLISLVLALALGGLVLFLLGRERSGVATRINEFLHSTRAPAERLLVAGDNARARLANSPQAKTWLGKLDRNLEIAQIQMRAPRLAILTGIATAVTFVLIALVSPVLALLALLVPLAVRSWVKRRLRHVRDEFGDQLPSNLQVLASAMRAGHSFSGALAVVVENAHEPSRRELGRAVQDDQLGISTDVAIRRVADRMANKDLQQVALLSELQRTAGGNAAEVLDTVVDTIRERGEVRRLVRTLTAQGRMARWILTAVPAVAGFFLWLMDPALMDPLFTTTTGQIALVIAAGMVACGSLMIQKIIEIKV